MERVRCPNLCQGGWEFQIKDGPRTYNLCPVCSGEGRVKPEDLKRLIKKFELG
jgi:hypothetical protein